MFLNPALFYLVRIKDLERQLKEKDKEIEKKKKELADEREKIESPKKIPAHLHATTRMKIESILEFSTRFDVKKMCEVLGVNRSSYYRWLKRRKKYIEENTRLWKK